MKTWKRVFALLLSLVMAVSLCACAIDADPTGGTAEPGPSSSASPDPGAAPSIEVDLTQGALKFAAGLSPADVLLTVDGEEIRADLFCYLLDQACDQFQQYLYYYYGLSLEDLPDTAGDLLDQGVNWTVYYTVLRRKAVELGCLLTDSQTAEINETAEDLNVKDQALMWELSDQSLRSILELESGFYYENLLDTVPTPGEDQLNGYVYQVRHILLKTIDDQNQPLSDEEIAAQRALAEDILSQLRAAEGEERSRLFDELMAQYSEDGRDENGDLYAPEGYTAVPGDMVTEFEEASLALPIGGLSDIVESFYGYHIILRDEVEDYSEYIDGCRAYLLDQEINALVDAAQVVRADALSGLNAVEFYTRLTAYQYALSARQTAE